MQDLILSKILKEITILYVEDNLKINQEMSRLLMMLCDDVKFAYDGEEALSIYHTQHIDLVITDIEMPKMDGLTLLENIKEIDKDIPIIILSAYTTSDYLLQAIELGITSYIVKPINYKKIKEALYKAIKVLNKNKNLYVKISQNLSFDKLNGFLIIEQKKKIQLKKKELSLMHLLLKYRNNLVTYEMIEEEIWRKSNETMSATALRTVVKKLRAKTEIEFIKNLSGLGYKLVSD